MKVQTKKAFMTIILALVLMNLTTVCVILVVLDRNTKALEDAKAEEVLARIGDNRMLRARSNFELPGFTPTHLERVTRNADTMGIPWWVPAGIAKHENGGDTLEVGMQIIPMNIRMNTPVMEWQYVALMRMLNQQAWRVILSDPELLPKVLIPFAQNYKSSDPQLWLKQTNNAMIDFRSREEISKVAHDTVVSDPPSPSKLKKKKPSTKKFHRKFRINPKLKRTQGENKQ